MTVLNFPPTNSQPTDGSFTYTANGVIYAWDGEKWTANSEQGLDGNFVNIDGDTMTGDLTVPNLISDGDVTAVNGDFSGDVQTTSLNGGPLAGLRNQLINGDFRVWQRGDTFTANASNTYTADRWLAARGTGTDVDVVRSSGKFLSFTDGSILVRNNSGSLRQGVELTLNRQGNARNGQFAVGSQWTLSVYSTVDLTNNSTNLNFVDTVSSATNSVTAATASNWELISGATDGEFERYKITFTITGTCADTNRALEILLPSAQNVGDVYYAAVQLEPGSVATPFEQRPYGLERHLCERYYYKAPDGIWRLYQSGASRIQANLWFPTTMRATPTCQLFNVNASPAVTSVTANDPTPRGFLAVANPNNSTLPGSTEVYAGTYSGDAEL